MKFSIFFLSIFLFIPLFANGNLSNKDRKGLSNLLDDLLSNEGLKVQDSKDSSQKVPLEKIKVWDSKDSIRVVIYPKEQVKFRYNLLHGKDMDRIYIDLLDSIENGYKPPKVSNAKFLKEIRFGRRKDALRVVLDIGRVESYNVTVMEEPWRIVVDYYGKKQKKSKSILKTIGEKKKSEQKKSGIIKVSEKKKPELKKESEDPFVIVIDPGHGGKDPGAVYRKTYEKDIVYRLARMIKKRASKYSDIKVVLTRNSDKFLPLEERAVVANRKDGDIFISLHANAERSGRAEGLEIYHLDNRRDNYASKLALVENRITNKNSALNNILVGMTMSLYINDSLRFSKSIGKNLSKNLKKYKSRVRDYRKGALFYVLVGARMPSILVEVGFITNKKDRRLMRKDSYLSDVADSILKGVRSVKKKGKLVKGMEK